MHIEEKTLIDFIPEINNGQNKTMLYVGANKSRAYLTDRFLKAGYKIDCLEIYEPNAEYWKTQKTFNNIIIGDVRNIDTLVKDKYDVVVWWHGPEHIPKVDVYQTFLKIEDITNELIVSAGPYKGAVEDFTHIYGNSAESHLWSMDELLFENLDFKFTVVDRPQAERHMMIWKFLGENE